MPSLSHIITGLTQEHVVAIAELSAHNPSATHQLQHAVVEAFLHMQQAAAKDNVDCQIASSYRSFAQQQSIWDRKMQGILPIRDDNDQIIDISQLTELEVIYAIMRFSALPGTSRHHWGTDFDVYDKVAVETKQYSYQMLPSEYLPNAICGELALWLQQNAGDYGFYFPYAEDNGGVSPEPWHLSYHPLSIRYEEQLDENIISHALTRHAVNGYQTINTHLKDLMQRFIYRR